ncbi:ribulose-phosphate 3-epimerase [Staphylococcus simiae]|uniref:ribulose-phosphate 3-epimerase n=1 Tax=Staphylococcus simiae CCM 7213 = CCUG 51256 TaxID=911238 RepID=G5JJR2_9STAP|nr:ribulose-phosphate 3-epimerase [Staphylococcus simiae]EHJ07569.1 ribulose-phosphate 3-epimerase [Staphylococcus simiae CCM 7213 = CCUG 51256]PNZ14685.1 ribulose-phosphate 3-epimerase [Staphylococcus simiae]SNV55206.1 ribulose-phosphate 3-epimerase [Staphylococcus simiae]
MNKKNEFFPSMMCANFANLKKEIKTLDDANVDGFHVDIMDGQYVPNFGMGLQDLKTIRKETDNLVDVHLMINDPSNYIDFFANEGVDIIYFHPDTDKQPARTVQKIQQNNIQAGIAINPDISIETIKPLLNLVDKVLVMTVNPGFSGQKYLEFVNEKIGILTSDEYLKHYNFEVFVDGAISPSEIEYLRTMGVKGFVLGTSTLFNKEDSYKTIIEKLKKGEN